MPCDRFPLPDYARICVQMPGDSYETVQRPTGRFACGHIPFYAVSLKISPFVMSGSIYDRS